MGASGASAPPASITSARASRIAWNASPTAIVPEAQLMALVEFGPVKPNSMAMLQLAAPGNTASASPGSSPRGPCVRKPPTPPPPSPRPDGAPGPHAVDAPSPPPVFHLASIPPGAPPRGQPTFAPGHRPGASRPPCVSERLPPGRWPGVHPTLHVSLDPRQRPRRDAVNEHGADHEIRRQPADERPGESRPLGDDRYNRADVVGCSHSEAWARQCTALKRSVPQDSVSPSPRFSVGSEPPHDAHARRDTPHVAIPDFAGRAVDRHVGHPPDRIAQRSQRAPCGHLVGAAAVVAVEKTNPTIVRQERRPAVHGCRDVADPIDPRAG